MRRFFAGSPKYLGVDLDGDARVLYTFRRKHLGTPPCVMPYSSIYQSPWHNPGLLLLGNVLFVLYLVFRKGGDAFFRKLLFAYAFLAMADCIITGGLSPLSPSMLSIVPFPFIILGDTRFFFLVESYSRPFSSERTIFRIFGKTFLISLIVPATSYFAQQGFFPKADVRWMFLLYESLFIVVASVFAWRVLRPGDTSKEQRRWLRGIVAFELVFYALWAMADVVILSGHDWGHLLRIVPNVLYYVGFVWFVALSAPKELRP